MGKRRGSSTSSSSLDDECEEVLHKRKRAKASTKNDTVLKPSTFKRSRSTSSGSDTSSSNESKKKKKKKRKDKKDLHSKKKHKKKQKKHKRKKNDSLEGPSKLETKTEDNNCDIPLNFMDKSKAMAPMTKEQWEAQQSVVRRVYDESTGRSRYIRNVLVFHKVKL